MQQVIIDIEDGTPTISVKGVKGKSCKDVTRALEKALGDTTETKLTGEYHESAQANKASH